MRSRDRGGYADSTRLPLRLLDYEIKSALFGMACLASIIHVRAPA